MSKSWQLLIIIAFLILGLYAGFEIYNSIVGGNVKFRESVDEIDSDLGKDVLDHVSISVDDLYYQGEE